MPLGMGGRESVADHLPDQIRVFISKPNKKKRFVKRLRTKYMYMNIIVGRQSDTKKRLDTVHRKRSCV